MCTIPVTWSIQYSVLHDSWFWIPLPQRYSKCIIHVNNAFNSSCSIQNKKQRTYFKGTWHYLGKWAHSPLPWSLHSTQPMSQSGTFSSILAEINASDKTINISLKSDNCNIVSYLKLDFSVCVLGLTENEKWQFSGPKDLLKVWSRSDQGTISVFLNSQGYSGVFL